MIGPHLPGAVGGSAVVRDEHGKQGADDGAVLSIFATHANHSAFRPFPAVLGMRLNLGPDFQRRFPDKAPPLVNPAAKRLQKSFIALGALGASKGLRLLWQGRCCRQPKANEKSGRLG